MPVWPKSFYTFGLSLKTAGTEWKLRHRRAGAAVAQQERTFARLVRSLAATSWGKLGVTERMAYAEFQARVPLQSYAQLAPALERMKRGEADVLWPGRCTLFVQTAGTATGTPKILPVTEPMLAHFRQMQLDALLYHCVRQKHAGVFRGRHLALGGSTRLTPLAEAAPQTAFVGELPAIQALARPAWAERHHAEPPPRLAQLEDWDARLKAIAAHASSRDITLLAAPPPAALGLARELRAGIETPRRTLTALTTFWPNLECLLHRGVPIGPFYEDLRAILGRDVRFHEVYCAAEAMIATQDGEPIAGLRLMADGGVFFEFLPLADYHELRLAELGPKAVPLAAVKPGIDYVLLLTTPAGLVRYVLGDVVRFPSIAPHRLLCVGRTDLRLNPSGETISEKEVTDALAGLCRRRDWSLTDFHVAPLPGNTLKGQRNRHEWWIELKAGTVATPTGPQIAAELDAELSRVNADYAARRQSSLGPPVVRLVMPGVFEHWLRFHGKWGGENKTPRCRADRLIAEDLAQITNFAPE